MSAGSGVVHVVPSLFGYEGVFGGAERYVFELARYMARVRKTTLLTFGAQPRSFLTDDGLRIRVLPGWKVRRQSLDRVHPALLRTIYSAAVVHCHQPHTLAAEIAAIVARVTGRGVFATDLGGGGWGVSTYFRTDSWFDGHLHLSVYSEKISGHTGMKGSKVIYGGVDAEVFTQDLALAKEPLIVFVGRLLPHKGIDGLIAALPSGLSLEIIGRPYDNRYYADLQRLAAGKNVVFRQSCDDDAIVRAYQRALCVVLPSVYRDLYGHYTPVPELLGQTLLEGMACGTPAICTDVASLPEVVDHGKTGFIVPAHDPAALQERLEFLRDNPASSRAMGTEARKRMIENFSWPGVVAKCLTAYDT